MVVGSVAVAVRALGSTREGHLSLSLLRQEASSLGELLHLLLHELHLSHLRKLRGRAKAAEKSASGAWV